MPKKRSLEVKVTFLFRASPLPKSHLSSFRQPGGSQRDNYGCIESSGMFHWIYFSQCFSVPFHAQFKAFLIYTSRLQSLHSHTSTQYRICLIRISPPPKKHFLNENFHWGYEIHPERKYNIGHGWINFCKVNTQHWLAHTFRYKILTAPSKPFCSPPSH